MDLHLLNLRMKAELPLFDLLDHHAGNERREISENADGDVVLTNAGGFGKVRARPEPTGLHGDGLEGFQEHGLAHTAQTGKHHVGHDGVLGQQLGKFRLFILAARKVGRRVSGSGAEWVLKWDGAHGLSRNEPLG